MASTILSDITYGLGLLASFGANVDVVGIYANGSGNSGGANASGLSSSLINSLVGSTGVTADFGQMFGNARPVKAIVRETSKIMEHPLETGVVIADHHIINPVEIDLQMIVNSQFYATTYAQMRQAFVNATLLAVKTRVGTYSNMIIADMPHEEDAEMYDSIIIGLHLKQVLYVTPNSNTVSSNFQPLNPVNNNTILSGLQQGASLGTQAIALAGSISSYANLAQRKLF